MSNSIFVGYGQIDPSAKPDSIPSSTDKQPWNNVSDLKLDGIIPLNVQTCEHNQGILDGTQVHMPSNPTAYRWGYWPLSLSDSNGLFATPPTIVIDFTYTHSGPGVTLLFYPYSDDYAKDIKVTWYDSNYSIITAVTYENDSIIAQIDQTVNKYKRITIEFLSTNMYNRYIKLLGINFGTGESILDSEIDNAYILEEVDPISKELRINTVNLTVNKLMPKWSIVHSKPEENMLMQNQQFEIEYNKQYFGMYFLQFPVKDIYGKGNKFDLQLVDAVGAMDLHDFWGDVYTNKPITQLLDQIFAVSFPTQIIKYELDSVFSNTTISGWIPICKCREALRLICFAIGAIADDSRRNYIWIYPPDTELTDKIPVTQMYRETGNIETIEYYSGVDITAYEYLPSEEGIEVFNANRSVGRHTIRFNEPVYRLAITTNATLIEYSSNYAIINVRTAGTVIISGRKYIVNNPVYSVRTDANLTHIENIDTYENETLVHPSIAQSRAQTIYNYRQNQAAINVDIFLDKRTQEEISNDIDPEFREVGIMSSTPTYGYPINGTIEKLDNNLRGGRAQMRVVGNVNYTMDP